VHDGIAERRDVKLGKRRPGEVEIRTGLAEHERVVVEGTQNVHHGVAVREQHGETPEPTST
jgi:membrane fusion protein (multidrug efflux system)